MFALTLARPRSEILPVKLGTLEAARRLRRVLREAGFTFQAAVERMGIDYRMWSGKNATCEKVRKYLSTAPVDRFDAFLRFFTLGVALERKTLEKWLSSSDIENLCEMNLCVESADGSLLSPVSLFECRGLFIVTDAITQQTADFNFVMPLLPESYEFASAVLRNRVDTALDLCTGSGIHALLAAQHSRTVQAVDISRRAIAFSEFNLWLNETPNVTLTEGDLFDSVRGRTFDLILANPPYEPVAASDSRPGDNYYCGGPNGDALTSKIFQGLHRFLRPNGICHVIHMMVSFDHGTQEKRIREWLGPASDECSIIVLSRPIAFRSETITGATSVEFGVTSVKRHADGRPPRYLSGAFDPAMALDIADLFRKIESEA
jgi:hypothetical protein